MNKKQKELLAKLIIKTNGNKRKLLVEIELHELKRRLKVLS